MKEIDEESLAEIEAFGGGIASEADETAPAVVDDYGEALVRAKRGLMIFQTEAEALKKAVFELTIKDDLSCAKASEYKATAQKVIKRIDARVKEMTQDASDYIQGVRNFAANLKAPLSESKVEAENKLTRWAQYARLEREKQDKAAREAIAREQERINRSAIKAGIEPVVLADPAQPLQRTVIRTDTGTTFELRKWRGTILDPERVELRYCSPDPKKIQEAIDGGARNPDIPGVDIFEEVKMVTRTR